METPVAADDQTINPPLASGTSAPEARSLYRLPEGVTAEQELERFSKLNLVGLQQEKERLKAANNFTPETKQLFQSLGEKQAADYVAQIKDLPASAVVEKYGTDVAMGVVPSSLRDLLVPLVLEKQNKQSGQNQAVETVKQLGKTLGSDPVGTVKEIAGGFIKGGVDVAKNVYKGVVEGDEAAASELVSSLETGALQSANLVKGISGAVTPDWYAKKLPEFMQPRQLSIEEAAKNNDGDGVFDAYLEAAAPKIAAKTGNGLLTRALGMDREELEKQGVRFDADSVERIEGMGTVLDPTQFSFALAPRLLGEGARIAVEAAPRLGKAGEVIGKLASKVAPEAEKTLARVIETKAGEATRLAAEAGPIATAFRNARKAAGSPLIAMGNKLQGDAVKMGSTSGAAAVAAAGLTLANGGDAKDAGYAILAGLIGAKALKTNLTGKALVKTGAAIQDLPLPFSNLRKAIADTKILDQAAKGALAGAGLGTVLAVGADNPEEAAGLISGGAVIGGASGGFEGVQAFGRDKILKSKLDDGSAQYGPFQAGKVQYGTDPVADAVHARAEAEMSQGGLGFVQSLRQAIHGKGEFYAPLDGEGVLEVYNQFAKTPVDPASPQADSIRAQQGVTIDAEFSKTGKPVAIAKVMGSAGGHEVTHAILSALQSTPEGKVLHGNLLKTAAESVGAVYDPATQTLLKSSPLLDQITEHYRSLIQDPVQKAKIGSLYGLNEWIAEHGSAQLSGAPAGKMGGSSATSKALGSAMYKIADLMFDRRAGIGGLGPKTSEALPYNPSFKLLDAISETIRAKMGEENLSIPDNSIEATNPAPEVITPKAGPAPEPIFTRPADETPTPLAPKAVDEETKAPLEAVRGPEVQAARDNLPAELTPRENAAIEAVQPDVAKQPVAKQLVALVKKLAGRSTDLPVVEMAYRDETTGAVYSKRVAPYGYEISSNGKMTVVAADLDRVNYNAKLLFDWAASKGTPERFGYTGINDPKFVQDVQTYLKNQAESRRGSGEPLMENGQPSIAKGEPSARLTREQEQFFSTIMGQAIPEAATTRSVAAIARIKATAKASGIEVIDTPTGAVEPNLFRNQLRQEGAPIDKIGEDPDPTRRQANPKGRNSVVMQVKLPNVESFQETGQTLSKPNIRAIEASFMPSAAGQPIPQEPVKVRSSNADIRRISQRYVTDSSLPYRPHEKAIPVKEELARRIADYYDKAVDSPKAPEVKAAYTALADEVVKQWKAFEAEGYTAEPWTGAGQPYVNSAAMMKDVRDNKHIYYFSTEGGFGTGGITAEMARTNPMLAKSGISFGTAKNVPVNDVFRVVHDIVGHGAHGYEFGPKGEFNAYLEHSRMFSDAAKPALAAETLAQNSWVNFGPQLRRPDGSLPKKGEAGYIPPAERRFADQKNIVIPEALLREADAYADQVASPSKNLARAQDFSAQNIKDILDKKGWVIATAENPRDAAGNPIIKTAAENLKLNEAMKADLDAAGLEYIQAKGKYGVDENPFIIFDPSMTVDAATALAKKYGQESVLTNHGLVYSDGTVRKALGITTYDTPPADNFTSVGDLHFAADLNWDAAPLHPRSKEVNAMRAADQSAPKAAEAPAPKAELEPAGRFMPNAEAVQDAQKANEVMDAAVPAARFMPVKQTEKSLSSAKVAGKDVQFKAAKPLKGSIGKVLDIVHFSSKDINQIDPNKSFGKGAATPSDRQGMNKAFFYVEGTAYEAPIASRPNAYRARVDGSSIYDLNTDTLGVQQIVNREKRDQAIINAGFKGFYVETAGFDAVAIYDKIDVKPVTRQEVMTPSQMKALGLSKQEAPDASAASRSAILNSPEYRKEAARVAKRVGSSTNGEYFDTMDAWIETKLAGDKAEAGARFMPEEAKDTKGDLPLAKVKVGDYDDVIVPVKDPTPFTVPNTPAPDAPTNELPLTGNPIKWSESRFMPSVPEHDMSAYPILDAKLLAEIEAQSPTLAAIYIDRAKVGEYKGVPLQGGVGYPTIKENLEKGVVWAFNSKATASAVAKRAAANGGLVKLMLLSEGNVVGNKTFGEIWFKELKESVASGNLSETSALRALNEARKAAKKSEGKLGGVDKSGTRNAWVLDHQKDWKTLDEAKQAILNMPQMARSRTYFSRGVTTTKAEGEKVVYGDLLAKKLTSQGFPDAQKIVENIEEPAFKGVPDRSVVAVIRFDPVSSENAILTAQEAGVPEHMSYKYVLKGKPVARLAHYTPLEKTFPEIHPNRMLVHSNTNFPTRQALSGALSDVKMAR